MNQLSSLNERSENRQYEEEKIPIDTDSNIHTDVQSESLNIPSDKFDSQNMNILQSSVTASQVNMG